MAYSVKEGFKKKLSAYFLRVSKEELDLLRKLISYIADPEVDIEDMAGSFEKFDWPALTLQQKLENPYNLPGDGQAICPECGKMFIKNYARNSTYCSNACHYPKQWYPYLLRDVKCPVCGKTFKQRGNRRYCSAECSRKAKQKPDDSEKWEKKREELLHGRSDL